MKSAMTLRVSLGSVSAFVFGTLISLNAVAADVASAVVAGKAVVRSASAPAVKPAITGKTVTTTGAVAGKAGDNQYPSGTPIVPPKPKKEGLEAAGAIKAKAAQP